MIKMVVSDMDGTLLNEECEMAPDMIEIIKRLNEKKILFVAASGRQYVGMSRFFEEVKNDIYFLAENGAFGVYQGKEFYSSVMKKELVHEILEEADKTNPVEILLCGKYFSYTDKPETAERIQQKTHRYAVKVVKSLYDVEDEIVKVSIMERNPGKKESFQMMQPLFADKAEIAVSGLIWYDIVNKDVNKGNTLHLIQKKLGIREEETMAFGDNYNDIEMLRRSGKSYVTENAEDGVKKYGRKIIGHHNTWPVAKEIKRVLLQER